MPNGTKELVTRIELRMAALGLNAAEVSRKAKLGNTATYDILNGKNLSPSIPVIKAIAKVLECSTAYLVGETDQPGGQPQFQQVAEIPVIGVAEAGAFRRMADFDQEDVSGLRKIVAAFSTSYPTARHFALLIRGDSMNEAKPYPLLDGLTALCVDVADAGLEVESGKIYAVRRTLDGGQTYECTVKRAKVFRDRFELHPESSNPEYKPLIILRSTPADHDPAEISVIGLVYGVTFEEIL
jgi:SOS-response transcriptional repressor LexA